MAGLSELTAYSQTSYSYTDNRTPGPKFNVPAVFDLDFTETTLTFPIDRQGLEILEVVNPSTADVKLIVETTTADASVSWSNIPTGSSVSKVGNSYTIDGIDSVAIWDQIKDPDITLTADFAGSFQYFVTITWYDGLNLNTKTYTVGLSIPAALFESSTTISCEGDRIRTISEVLLAEAELTALDKPDLFCQFSLDITATLFKPTSSTMSSAFTTEFKQQVMNLNPAGYLSNQKNTLYPTDPPFVRNSGASTYTLVFTVTDSSIALTNTGSISNTLTISGTLGIVNDQLDDLLLFPDFDHTGDITMTVVYSEDSVEQETFEVTIPHLGAGVPFTTQFVTFETPGTTNTTFTYEQVTYGNFRTLLVGGGGGGAYGGGGGGGRVLEVSNLTPTYSSSYAITVGEGGAANRSHINLLDPNAYDRPGDDGTSTSAFGYTAQGGEGGQSYSDADPFGSSVTQWNYRGGNSGFTGSVNTGGNGAPFVDDFNHKYYNRYTGGGGAGANDNGTSAHIAGYASSGAAVYAGGDGGEGKASNITGSTIYYGGGGGGSNGNFWSGFNLTDDFPNGGTQPSFPFKGGGHGWYGTQQNGAPEAGDDGYGGGGGGGSPYETYSQPARGGHGIVIIKVTAK